LYADLPQFHSSLPRNAGKGDRGRGLHPQRLCALCLPTLPSGTGKPLQSFSPWLLEAEARLPSARPAAAGDSPRRVRGWVKPTGRRLGQGKDSRTHGHRATQPPLCSIMRTCPVAHCLSGYRAVIDNRGELWYYCCCTMLLSIHRALMYTVVRPSRPDPIDSALSTGVRIWLFCSGGKETRPVPGRLGFVEPVAKPTVGSVSFFRRWPEKRRLRQTDVTVVQQNSSGPA